MKSPSRHASNSCGQSDEGADYRQQPGYEDGEISPAGEKSIGPIQFAPAHQNPAAVFFYQRTAAVASDLVCDQRSQVATDGSGGGDPKELHCALVDQVAGEGHDQFGGQGYAGRFDGHEEGEAAVAGHGDYRFDEDKKNSENFLSHEKIICRDVACYVSIRRKTLPATSLQQAAR